MRKLLLLLFLSSYLYAELFSDIQRRRDQFLKDFGYFAAPVPYSLPGIGEGLLLFGMANNIKKSQTDLMFNIISGDVGGYGFGIGDLYLIDKHLKVEILQSNLDKASVQSYSSRGMNSNEDDYLNIQIKKAQFTAIRTTVSFYEKMLEFYFMNYINKFSIDSLRDKDGTVILGTSDGLTYDTKSYIIGFMVDYTDDRQDPREGLRFDASVDYAPEDTAGSADFYISSFNTTLYIPFGRRSSWAFNYFRSDAHVIHQGIVDYNQVSQNMGLDCTTIADPVQKSKCENVINNTITANRYGTATSLGGRGRLRSYPEGRFKGAHTQFYGTEFRWNMTKERSPFDIWFMKDIRTGIQSAFFYERGSVAELTSDLWKNEHESYGFGIRMITASGLVYRLDLAHGDEGYETTMIINYPWEIF